MESISKIMMNGMFDSHTYDLVLQLTSSLNLEGMDNVSKESVLAFMITMCEDRRAQLLIVDKGINGLCDLWNYYIEDNMDDLLERCNREFDNRRAKMMYVFELFIEEKIEE